MGSVEEVRFEQLDHDNLFSVLHRAAGLYGDKPLLETVGGETHTFAEFELRAVALSEALTERGVSVGSRLAVEADASSFIFECMFAAAKLGAAVLPLNPNYTADERKHLLDTMQPQLVVTLEESASEWQSVTQLELAQKVEGYIADDVQALVCASSHWVAGPDSIARFGVTSGSSGLPKIVAKSHSNWVADGRAAGWLWGLTSTDRVLSAQPLYYGDPFILLNACLHSGATSIYVGRFRSQDFFSQVKDTRATLFLTIGAMPYMLLNSPVSEVEQQHSARAGFSVAIPPAHHAELEARFGVEFREMYGTAEIGCVVGEPFDSREHSTTVGTGNLGGPLPGVTIRLRNSDGTLLDGAGTGLAELKGPTVARHGYLGEDQGGFLPGGWYSTGDFLTRLSDGSLQYAGRAKDVVRRAGENISCQEVENALRRHENVLDAAVLPRPDPVREEEVWATVSLDRDATSDVALELDSFLAGILTRHKLPRFYSFVPDFPRTPTERVNKPLLKKVLENTDPDVDLGERAHKVKKEVS